MRPMGDSSASTHFQEQNNTYFKTQTLVSKHVKKPDGRRWNTTKLSAQ